MPKTVDDVLSHYGIKGMQWGVRRSRKELARLRNEPVTVKTAPGERVKAKGGRKTDPSTDAINAAVLKRVASVSTIDSLSNAQIRDLTQRMQLEQQYADLVRKQQPPKGRIRQTVDKFVEGELKAIGNGKPPTSVKLAKALAGSPQAKKAAGKAAGKINLGVVRPKKNN